MVLNTVSMYQISTVYVALSWIRKYKCLATKHAYGVYVLGKMKSCDYTEINCSSADKVTWSTIAAHIHYHSFIDSTVHDCTKLL